MTCKCVCDYSIVQNDAEDNVSKVTCVGQSSWNKKKLSQSLMSFVKAYKTIGI